MYWYYWLLVDKLAKQTKYIAMYYNVTDALIHLNINFHKNVGFCLHWTRQACYYFTYPLIHHCLISQRDHKKNK